MKGNLGKAKIACTRETPLEDDSTTVTSSPTYLTDSCNSDSGSGERCSSEETASGHGATPRVYTQRIDSSSQHQTRLSEVVHYHYGESSTHGLVIQSKPLGLKNNCEGAGRAPSCISDGFASSGSNILSCNSIKPHRDQPPGLQWPQINELTLLDSARSHSEKNGLQKRRSKTSREIRANPTSLAKRKILTKTNRLVTAPVKLSNWRVSWQELLCYNPRPYNITEAFMDNCRVVRGMMETYVQKITDIVFVDKCTARMSPPYIYHAYLLPPITPHEWSTAACIQCYTSDNAWLEKGAWRRVEVPGKGGTSLESMQPMNPLLIPFMPAFTKEEQQNQQKIYYIGSNISAPQKTLTGNELYDSSSQILAKNLPLHLWIFLMGKDMQALDGLTIAWKLLRWASEIPPSEFVECHFSQHQTTATKRLGSLEAFKLYHEQVLGAYYRSSCVSMLPISDAPQLKIKLRMLQHGLVGRFPLIRNPGIQESSKYRVSFLMIDIPGYGNSTGHPSPCTIRSGVFQAVKQGIQELIEHHGEDSIVINILGYSLGCAVACSLASDIAAAFSRDSVYATPSAAEAHLWNNIASVGVEEGGDAVDANANSYIHSNVTFDEKLLTFRDAFNVSMFEQRGVEHVSKILHWSPSDGYRGLNLSVNRLILIAPFTSTQAMASKVAASAMGGSSFLTRAVGGLVSKQISWNNVETLTGLMKDIYHIKSQTLLTAFNNFSISIIHGSKDNVIPSAMGMELYGTIQRLTQAYNLNIPTEFKCLPGENHATVLSGASERAIFESCFGQCRLHPAGPLAMLKFYFKETRLPCCLPPHGIYRSSYKDVRDMQTLGPGQSFAYQLSSPTGSLLQSRSYAPAHCSRSTSFSGTSPLARANTIGGEVPLRALPSVDLPGTVGNFSAQQIMHSSAIHPECRRTSYTLDMRHNPSSLATSGSNYTLGPSAYPLRRLQTDGSLLQHSNMAYQSILIGGEPTPLQKIGVCNPSSLYRSGDVRASLCPSSVAVHSIVSASNDLSNGNTNPIGKR